MKSILLIDDDHDTRVTMREILEQAGYPVYSAANGADGYATLQRISPPGVILLDLRMPLMSGEEFLANKCDDPRLADIPVIVITAFEDRQVDRGYVDRWVKPLRPEQLLQAASRYCAVAV